MCIDVCSGFILQVGRAEGRIQNSNFLSGLLGQGCKVRPKGHMVVEGHSQISSFRVEGERTMSEEKLWMNGLFSPLEDSASGLCNVDVDTQRHSPVC